MYVRRIYFAILILILGCLTGLLINLATAKVSKSDYLVMVKWSDIPPQIERSNNTYQVKITKVSLSDRVVWIKFVKLEDEK